MKNNNLKHNKSSVVSFGGAAGRIHGVSEYANGSFKGRAASTKNLVHSSIIPVRTSAGILDFLNKDL